MKTIANLIRWLALGCVLALGLALAGCEPPAPRTPQPMAVGITGYTFTNEGVQEYSVNDSRGSNLPPYGGGGATSCCVSLPEQWTPGLTVKVDWITGHWTVPMDKIQAMDISEAIKCCLARRTLSKTVPVERYGEEGGGVQVFFLPNDDIKVWVSDYDLGFPGHPSGMAYPKKPASAQ